MKVEFDNVVYVARGTADPDYEQTTITVDAVLDIKKRRVYVIVVDEEDDLE